MAAKAAESLQQLDRFVTIMQSDAGIKEAMFNDLEGKFIFQVTEEAELEYYCGPDYKNYQNKQ